MTEQATPTSFSEDWLQELTADAIREIESKPWITSEVGDQAHQCREGGPAYVTLTSNGVKLEGKPYPGLHYATPKQAIEAWLRTFWGYCGRRLTENEGRLVIWRHPFKLEIREISKGCYNVWARLVIEKARPAKEWKAPHVGEDVDLIPRAHAQALMDALWRAGVRASPQAARDWFDANPPDVVLGPRDAAATERAITHWTQPDGTLYAISGDGGMVPVWPRPTDGDRFGGHEAMVAEESLKAGDPVQVDEHGWVSKAAKPEPDEPKPGGISRHQLHYFDPMHAPPMHADDVGKGEWRWNDDKRQWKWHHVPAGPSRPVPFSDREDQW